MSVFDSILNAIIGHNAQARTADAAQGRAAQSAGQAVGGGAQPNLGAAAGAAAGAGLATGNVGIARGRGVDVEAVLNERAAKKGEKLNWRTSIVDLMKLLDLDSSLSARKELAQELGYKGERDGSAEMNIWLHKQVMQKLAANGGKVPADLMS
jgi:Domain of unknown function (DUF3597)